MRGLGWLPNGGRLEGFQNQASESIPTGLQITALFAVHLAGNLDDTFVRQSRSGKGSQPCGRAGIQYATVGQIPAERSFGIYLVDVLATRSATASEERMELAGGNRQMFVNN